MRKLFFLIILGFCCSISQAQANQFDLNDTESFTIARSFKLGGTTNFVPDKGMTGGSGISGADCTTNTDCPESQRCSNGKCVDLCVSGSCPSAEEPRCFTNNHAYACECTSSSCPAGKKCSATLGICQNCTAGESCGCPAPQTANGSGGCQCVATTCNAGQFFSTDSCACFRCPSGEKCNCPGNSVSDGIGDGACHCPNPYTCAPGNNQNMTLCTCEPCPADSTSCGSACPAGQVPDGVGGCKSKTCTYATQLSYCSAGQFCNDGTQQCEPCFRGGTCLTCSKIQPHYRGWNGTTCIGCFHSADCEDGQECSNPNTSSSICVACPAGKWSTAGGNCTNCKAGGPCPSCPEGLVGDGYGRCMPACTPENEVEVCDQGQYCGISWDGSNYYNRCTGCSRGQTCLSCHKLHPTYRAKGSYGACTGCFNDANCPSGKYCANPDTTDSLCTNCPAGATCSTCPSGQVGNGSGGCKIATSEPACDSNGMPTVCPSSAPYRIEGKGCCQTPNPSSDIQCLMCAIR